MGRLDRALVHPPGDDRRFEQVAAVLREDDALAGRPDLVTRPTDPLQAAGDARRALDLDDEVHRAHVDAEFQRAGGDECGQPARLEFLLDGEALFTGDAAVMGLDQFLAGQLVEALGEPLAQAPAVGEDDRAAMAADELEDRAGGWPARCWNEASALVAGPPGCSSSGRTSPMRGHVLDRHDDAQFERLARAGIDDRDVAPGPIPAMNPAIASSGRCVADRPIRCGGVVAAGAQASSRSSDSAR